MHRSATGGGLVLFAAVALALSAPAAAEAQALGRLYIEALDGDGQVVPGLTTSDFVVLEDDTRGEHRLGRAGRTDEGGAAPRQ